MDIKDRKGYIHKSVKIGNYTFIGGGSCIMPGVTIGKGCVVGVNSVVTKDIPDFSIAVGVPAKVIASTKELDLEFLRDDIGITNYYDADIFNDFK